MKNESTLRKALFEKTRNALEELAAVDPRDLETGTCLWQKVRALYSVILKAGYKAFFVQYIDGKPVMIEESPEMQDTSIECALFNVAENCLDDIVAATNSYQQGLVSSGFNTIYDFIVDVGLESLYLAWRKQGDGE